MTGTAGAAGAGPLVSVITPTYNQGRFLGACVESVLSQTYPRWEQIVVDDDSTDDTAAVVASYADPRLRYVRQPHGGLERIAATYNRALAEARGSLVAILEGDDAWAPTKLEELVPCFDDDAIVLAYSRATVLSPRERNGIFPDAATERALGPGVLTNRPVGSAARAMLHARLLLLPSALVIRRDALDAIGGFQHVDGLGVTDVPTQLRLALLGTFVYAQRSLAYWRRHPSAASLVREYEIVTAACAYSVSFAREHRAELGLADAELDAIARSLRRRIEQSALGTGRALLVAGRWDEARGRFRVALRSRSPRIALAGLAGYSASWIHRDIETFARLAGRADLRAPVRE